jgi:purine-binding chemotaxis protein CheW
MEQQTRQILTFTLGSHAEEEEATDYGIDLGDVQEIRGYTPATPIPNTPAYIKGAINLRGSVIPVIDLRIRFGTARISYTKFTVIIVVNIHSKTIGLVADGVSDVLSIEQAQIMPPPDFGSVNVEDCVEGIAEVEGHLVLMLNLRKMLAPDGIVDPAPALVEAVA